MNMPVTGLALDRVGVFQDLDAYALQEVAAVMEPVKLAGGVMLFDEGAEGDTLYIVAHGRLRVSVAARGERRTIAELGRGESVGEMALLTGERRSARVEAIRDSVLLALSRPAFDRVVEKYPRVMTQLARQLVERLKSSLRGARSRTNLSTLCVVAAVPGLDISTFCERLARAMSQIGSTLHLTRESVRTALAGGAGAAPGQFADDTHHAAWLNEQEEHYAYVLYETDAADCAWTHLCERQADRVVFVAQATDGPRPLGGTAAAALEVVGTARRELVLLNDERPRAGAMQRWLKCNPALQAWHHVTENNFADIARLARLSSGQGVGLVLGGGGARSFAHIGVIRALREAGIEIDSIGGVSGGAVVGAQFAMGRSAAEVKEAMRAEFVNRGSLLDFTVPIVSLIKGQRFIGMLTRLFGDTSIEDVPRRFFCASANLSQAVMRIHDRGPLWRSIGASMCIPGIGPPVCENGDLLIDGSVLTNLPVEAMREICHGQVVAVDVSADKDLTVDRSWDMFPTPSRLMLARPWRRRGLRIPNILEILFRGAMLGSIAGERNIKDRVDFYFRPPLRGVGLLDFKALDRVERAAYEYAVQALEQWPGSQVPGALGVAGAQLE